MTGIDFSKASIDIRERFALTTSAQAGLLARIRHLSGVSGCAIINTCNRMELWLSVDGSLNKSPIEILCDMLKADIQLYGRYFTHRSDIEAKRHLFKLACGLKSLIFGEEQILTQVKESIAFARDCKASDAILEALFRRAVTAAKKAKTNVRLTTVDPSSAETAVQILKKMYGNLRGLTCLVIGSGEMGRLAAGRLVAEGCDVHMTLRQYRSGEAVIPTGCHVIDYDARYQFLKNAKAVISATRSPHFTLFYYEVRELIGTQEMMLFDLAVPRDIDPEIAQLPNVTLYDIDSLGGNLCADNDHRGVAEITAIIDEEIQEFERWNTVRELMPRINEISAAAASDVEERIQSRLKNIPLDDSCLKLVHEAAGKSVSKVVENILLSLRYDLNTGILKDFSPFEDEALQESVAQPRRFPLFVDLAGKKIVVIGAGQIALRRIKTLLNYPCAVEVIAPSINEDIARMRAEGKLILKEKEYETSDLDGAYLVLAATDNRALNHRIALDAGQTGQYCSIADCKEESTFFFPATVQYDGGVIGICGTGENHGRTKEIAADIREFMKTKEHV
jgi:glutamyl-tRNA reductase